MPPALWGLAAAGTVSAISALAGWLTVDGAVAATAVGAAVFAWGGAAETAALVAFFLSSSLLGRLPGRQRHGARNWRQVVANGGAAAIAAIGTSWHGWAREADAAAIAALAAAAADTWATEIGTRLGGAPRRLFVGPRLAAGESGGMTAAGTLGGLAGAGFVTLAAILVGRAAAGARPAASGAGTVPGAAAALLIAAAGAAGMLLDSALGASLQARFVCRSCGARIESPTHPACGGATCERVSGVRWLDNDGVNAAATILAAAVAIVAAVASGVP